MATTTSTVPAYLVALRDALNTRFAANPTFASVKAYAAPAGDPLPLEMVELVGTVGTEATQQWGALGNRRKVETYTVHGFIGALVAGAGEDVADSARSRVYAILAEVEDYLRTDPRVNATVMRSQLASANLLQDIEEGGRWAALMITIDVYTELNS